MFSKLKANTRKNKLLKEAFKRAGDPIWWIFYRTDTSDGTVKVYASTENEAKEKANFLISDITKGQDFEITGTAVI